jgi:hypothetical protein
MTDFLGYENYIFIGTEGVHVHGFIRRAGPMGGVPDEDTYTDRHTSWPPQWVL